MVERNLAKVEVAGSSPVVRSEASCLTGAARLLVKVWNRKGGVAERRGNGLQSRVHGFKSRLHLEEHERAIGAAVARFPDTEEVTGSIPVSPTSTKRPLTRRRESGAFMFPASCDLCAIDERDETPRLVIEASWADPACWPTFPQPCR